MPGGLGNLLPRRAAARALRQDTYLGRSEGLPGRGGAPSGWGSLLRQPADAPPAFCTGISRDTWLLFLPFLPVRAKAPVLLLIGLLVLVIIMVGLLLLGHLFFFHLYLSTCPEPRSASAEPCPVFAWSPGRQAGPAQSPETPEHGGQITGRGETPWGAAGPGSVPRRAENLEESHKAP